jgi:hypothetical protein
MPKAKQQDGSKKRTNHPGSMTTSGIKNQHMNHSRKKQARRNRKGVQPNANN